jgi:VanZ family protein
MASSLDTYEQNFCITQTGTSVLFRLFAGTPLQRHDLWIDNVLQMGKSYWFGLVYDGSYMRCFSDGALKAERHVGKIDVSVWNPSIPLVFGSEGNGYNGWSGIYHTAAFFNEVIPAISFRDPELLLRVHPPALLFRFDSVKGANLRSTGTDSTTRLIIPERYAPFRRTVLVEGPLPFWKHRIYFRDVIANALFFLPFGYLFGAVAIHRAWKPFLLALLATAGGLLLSLGIELLQVYLPGRFSSVSDVVSNTTGALAGILLFIFRKHLLSFFEEPSHR